MTCELHPFPQFQTDEDGEEASEGEDSEYEKGLNLREAEEYMKKADKEDKQRFQERIKAKHKVCLL